MFNKPPNQPRQELIQSLWNVNNNDTLPKTRQEDEKCSSTQKPLLGNNLINTQLRNESTESLFSFGKNGMFNESSTSKPPFPMQSNNLISSVFSTNKNNDITNTGFNEGSEIIQVASNTLYEVRYDAMSNNIIFDKDLRDKFASPLQLRVQDYKNTQSQNTKLPHPINQSEPFNLSKQTNNLDPISKDTNIPLSETAIISARPERPCSAYRQWTIEVGIPRFEAEHPRFESEHPDKESRPKIKRDILISWWNKLSESVKKDLSEKAKVRYESYKEEYINWIACLPFPHSQSQLDDDYPEHSQSQSNDDNPDKKPSWENIDEEEEHSQKEQSCDYNKDKDEATSKQISGQDETVETSKASDDKKVTTLVTKSGQIHFF